MRVLYLSQYFPPEAGATQTRAYEMGQHLVQMGHQVTMLAEVPNHPAGVIPPEYRGRLYERTSLEGMEVIRVWVKTSPQKNFRNRMLFYLSYMLNATLAGLFLARKPYDLIYATSPPLFVGGAALALSSIRRIPLVFEVRDLWPESAVALGELKNPRAIAWATRLEEACYRRARAVVVVTQGIRKRLLDRTIPARKLAVIPNGANVDLFHFNPQGRECIRSQYGWGDQLVAMYAGIHGIAQGLETVVDAARQLRSHSDIRLVLVGDGPRKAAVVKLALEYRLPNLTLLPAQPREQMPALLSAADVALVPLRDVGLFKGALPSKIFDAWACERPVLVSVDGEARQVVEAAGAGRFLPPENPSALAEALLQLREQPQDLLAMGQAGRRFTEQRYSRRAQAGQLAALLESVL